MVQSPAVGLRREELSNPTSRMGLMTFSGIARRYTSRRVG
jgi:hypothetical protein